MAYATRAELVTYGLPSAALTGISTDKQDAALEAASREADGYLNSVFMLPLTAYGNDLKQHVCNMAAFMLMKGRGFAPESADADMLVMGRTQAIKWLEGVAAGKIKPYGITDSGSGGINTDDLPADSRTPFVVQQREASEPDEKFWRSDTTGSGGGVGRPKRRGW